MEDRLFSKFERVYTEQTDLPVYRLGLDGHWCQNGWWGTPGSPISPNLDMVAFQAVNLEERKIYAVVLDLEGRVVKKQVINQDVYAHGSYHGGGVFWCGDGKHIRVMERGQDGKSLRYSVYDLISDTAVEDLPEGKPVVPGISNGGYMNDIDIGRTGSVPDESRYGLFAAVRGGEKELLYSIKDFRKIRKELRPDLDPMPDTLIGCNCMRWDAKGEWFYIELGNHEAARLSPHKPPRVNELWVCSRDFKTIRPVIPYIRGEDEKKPGLKSFHNHGEFDYPDHAMVTGATHEGVACANIDGSGLTYYRTGTGGGHCTMSPDKNWIIYDSYSTEEGNKIRRVEGYLIIINRKTKEAKRLLRFQRKMERGVEWWKDVPYNHGDGPLTVCGHPNFSRDGKRVTFNAMFGNLSQVCVADISSIVG